MSKVVKLHGPYGQSTAEARCETHGFDMSHMITFTSELCPIGQIEEATEKALARMAGTTQPQDAPNGGTTTPADLSGITDIVRGKRTRKAKQED